MTAGIKHLLKTLGFGAGLLLLGGCASTSNVASKPGVVMDAIQRELAVAAQPQKAQMTSLDAALLPPLTLEAAKPAAIEARFDISVQNAPVDQVFMAIVGGTPYSMLLPPELSGTLTLALKQVTVREVLDTIRDLYGYDFKVQGNRIFIQPNSLQTRVFQVNYLAATRKGSTQVNLTSTAITQGNSGNTNAPGLAPANQQNAANNAGSSGNSQQGGSQVLTTMATDFWKDIKQALESLVGTAEGRNVVINGSSGVVLVRAMPTELRAVESYLRTTQLVIERQVMLEAKIIEVGLSEEYQAGVNWANFGRLRGSLAGNTPNLGAFGAQGPGTTLSASGSLTSAGATASLVSGASAITSGLGFYGVAFQSANFAAMLNFLESQGSVHVLSSPRVATLNNQKAVLKVGNDEFFVTNVSTTTTSGTGATTTSPTVTLAPFFSGIALDVTPQIDENDQIILHVHPSVSTVTEKNKSINLGSGGSLNLPLASSSVNESDSIVRVKDGHIVAIGGLMRQRQTGDRSGLPGTNQQELTILGQRERTLSKSELVILIKPTVIREEADWRAGLLEAQTRLQEYAPPAPIRIIGR